ncbi:MAG: glucosamine-6-phosphate deaminase [Cyclobacteriaceae bacterium]|nr:glucosamine-6-phosphate deaminase [Cyclobacteriaceae bacterium]
MKEQLVSYERLNTIVFENSDMGSIEAAGIIREEIVGNEKEGKRTVLGLATGSSPLGVYKELVRMHREEGLSFKNVVTFNLDEYYPMQPGAVQSYVRFMNENLFDHIDIDKKNIHIPDGTIPVEEVPKFCSSYEKRIKEAGGIDVQLLGVGRTGHIGFNEPGSNHRTVTRMITLDKMTRQDAAEAFGGEQHVPRRAITMGVSSILKSKKIIMLAWGNGKAPIVKRMLEGPVSDTVPATYLQNHRDTIVLIDRPAAEKLTRFNEPWLVQSCKWDDKLVKKAVVWLCEQVDKPILKVTEQDYIAHGLSELLTEQGPAYMINIRVFNMLQHTITGWPGGKPNADDSQRPERREPACKRVIIFSPHPDDDVISMGATLMRLVDQGHDVHVAYQVSGNIAVADDEALRYAEFLNDNNKLYNRNEEPHSSDYKKILQFIKNKKEGDIDILEVRTIKGLIRKGEAKAAARYCGIKPENVHFLDMPFYETGRVKKAPIGEEDIAIITRLIEQVKPHQIYAAGDLADPHGTHRVCLEAIFQSVRDLKSKEFMKDCWVWLYRGAWHEWDIPEIEMAVPISPEELLKKRFAIFKHQSQKDGVVFQGEDSREFWQRAEQRNRDTAKKYDKLGMAEYEAMEAFVLWKYQDE